MERITSLEELHTEIKNRSNFWYYVDGKPYVIDLINLLDWPLKNILSALRSETLYFTRNNPK